MSRVFLEAIGVVKTFPNGVRALDHVDLAVREGETVALVGESGSGKSTLLRLFNRLTEPSGGRVEVLGRDVRGEDPISLRRHCGYVPQEGGLLPHWSVGRNVELVPSLLEWPRRRKRSRADELLDAVGLPPGEYRDRYPGQLSGGQRQRVAFARALAADPDLVLLDEPFGALDAITRVELQDAFSNLSDALGKTMLLVTHDLAEAMRLANRIAVMRQGRVHQLAPPSELLTNPATDYVGALLSHQKRRWQRRA